MGLVVELLDSGGVVQLLGELLEGGSGKGGRQQERPYTVEVGLGVWKGGCQ